MKDDDENRIDEHVKCNENIKSSEYPLIIMVKQRSSSHHVYRPSHQIESETEHCQAEECQNASSSVQLVSLPETMRLP